MNYSYDNRTSRYNNSYNLNNYHFSERHSSSVYDYFGNNYGIAFFIKERKEHYTLLNKYVFKPLSIIHEQIPESGNEAFFFSNLLFRIQPSTVNFNSIINSVFFKQALKHMENHAKELATELDSFKVTLDEHNKNADFLRLNIIPALIKREFETPLPIGHKYNYNHENLFGLVTYCLNEINKADELKLSFRNFKIENLESEYKENQIRSIIANTKENDETPIIISKINNIVKNTQISNILIGLRDSRQELRDSLRTINQRSLPISQTIESGDYNIKAKCCPTILRLIRKYVM